LKSEKLETWIAYFSKKKPPNSFQSTPDFFKPQQVRSLKLTEPASEFGMFSQTTRMELTLNKPLALPENLLTEIKFFFSEIADRFPSLVPGFLSPKFTDWLSNSYVELATQTQQRQNARHRLEADFVTFLDEKAKIADTNRQLLVIREYQFSICGVIYGETAPHQETTSSQVARFTEQIISQNGEQPRPLLEAHVAQTVENWMLDPNILPNQSLIWISPRGKTEEGYPGQNPENYALINVLTKKQTENGYTFELTQYLSYDTSEQLAELQLFIKQKLAATNYQLQLNTHLENSHFPQIDELEHHLIANLLTTSKLNFELFESELAKHTQEWYFQNTDFPQLNLDWYSQERNRLVDYLGQTFIDLVESVPPHVAIEYLDTLVQLSKKVIRKWVENHDQNFQENPPTQPQPINLEELELIWKKRTHQQLSRPEKKAAQTIFSTLKLGNPIARKMASVADCTIGTGPSLLNKVSKLDQLTQGNPLANLGGSLGLGAEGLKITSQEFEKYYVQIERAGQLWRVPHNYFEKGKTLDELFPIGADGLVYGPCGVPLVEDELAITEENISMIYP
jgi:hypothetical protein